MPQAAIQLGRLYYTNALGKRAQLKARARANQGDRVSGGEGSGAYQVLRQRRLVAVGKVLLHGQHHAVGDDGQQHCVLERSEALVKENLGSSWINAHTMGIIIIIIRKYNCNMRKKERKKNNNANNIILIRDIISL